MELPKNPQQILATRSPTKIFPAMIWMSKFSVFALANMMMIKMTRSQWNMRIGKSHIFTETNLELSAGIFISNRLRRAFGEVRLMQYKLLQIIPKIFNVFIEIKKIVSIIISTRYRRVLIIVAAIL